MQVLRAIGLMVLGMAVLAVGDGFVKTASLHVSLGQILLGLGIGGALIFAAIARRRGEAIFRRELFLPLMLLRNALEMLGAIGMVIGLAKVPLSVMAAIMQSAPLVVTLGAALVLKETVGPRRWAAVGIGLLGMLMVLRPFGEAFTGWELFGVMGVTALAARDLVTRVAPASLPTMFLSTWGILSIAVPGALFATFDDRPMVWSADALWPLLGAILVTPFGYLAVTLSMRLAPAAVVAPFRYTRLVFTTALGVVVFGERPDFWTLLGALVILGAGLFVFAREHQLARQAARDAASVPGR